MTFSTETLIKLAEVADAIETNPARFRMDTWVSNWDSPGEIYHGMLNVARSCNTAGCIAGWVLNEYLPIGEHMHADYRNAPTRALEMLEVDPLSPEADYLKSMFADRKWWVEREYVPTGGFENEDGDWVEDGDYDGLDDITADIAVTALRDLVAGEWL